MGRVVQTGELVAVEKKAGLVIGETVGPVIATVLLRQRFPEMDLLLRSGHFLGLAPSRVADGKEVEQAVVDQPGEGDDLAFRIGLLQ